MTRSITVTNTSNQQGEDYKYSGIPNMADVTLKPGESFQFTPDCEFQGLQIEEVESMDPTPFNIPLVDKNGKRRDKHVGPSVAIFFD